MRKDSLELTDADRAAIVAAATAAPEQRIVITHGTDTMTETAQALAEVSGKTIVLVGALAPARFAESDAAFNLGMAFAVAQAAIAASTPLWRSDRQLPLRRDGRSGEAHQRWARFTAATGGGKSSTPHFLVCHSPFLDQQAFSSRGTRDSA
jgi:hypothetical protein